MLIKQFFLLVIYSQSQLLKVLLELGNQPRLAQQVLLMRLNFLLELILNFVELFVVELQ